MERKRGKVTTDQFAAWYQTCKFASSSEKITKSLLENVNAMHNKFKGDSSILEVMHEA